MQVSYTAMIDGVSPGGNLVSFRHENTLTNVQENQITIQPLTPGITYEFRVSAMTSRGQGGEALVSGQTLQPESEYGM